MCAYITTYMAMSLFTNYCIISVHQQWLLLLTSNLSFFTDDSGNTVTATTADIAVTRPGPNIHE